MKDLRDLKDLTIHDVQPLKRNDKQVVVLHYHTAPDGCPFPPDGRREFSLIKGQVRALPHLERVFFVDNLLV